jgi:hypothetical protein
MDTQKLIGLGIAIAALIVAASAFRDDVVEIEHKGLTLVGGATLVLGGVHLFSTAETVDADLVGLFA